MNIKYIAIWIKEELDMSSYPDNEEKIAFAFRITRGEVFSTKEEMQKWQRRNNYLHAKFYKAEEISFEEPFFNGLE